MKFLLRWIPLLSIVGAVVLALPPLQHWWAMRNRPEYRTARVQQGHLVSIVNATGTVTPVLSVRVGSFTSGPVSKLHVDYNSKVKRDGLLAEIDPTLYEAVRDRDRATVAHTQAEVARVTAELEQAVNDEARAARIAATDRGFLSEEERDRLRAKRASLEAQLLVARAKVKEAEANLASSEKNLSWTKIRSPVDGVVIDRKIEEGQTLIAQLQAPDLFVVAQDLEKEIHIYASIDEADVELISQARLQGRPVYFTVDAHPNELFEGKIHQIRLNPAVKENVVAYTVVVSSANPYLKLLPGMTVKLTFEIDRRESVLKVPNSAFRFYPKVEHVREEDRKLLEVRDESATTDSGDSTLDTRSAVQRVIDRREDSQRHVWTVGPDGLLRAIPVTTGLSDYTYTEVLSGEVRDGMELVTGVKN